MTPDRDWVGELVLGRYRIVRPLAEGGMGVVYLGRVEGAAGFSRPVVVKTVIPHLRQDAITSGMFVREARILSNLQHPAIVGVIDFGEVRDSYVMVLEYVHGFHLGQWLRYLGYCQREVEIDHALFITTRVLDALQYAHQLKRTDGAALGIVHRDISPANVLIDAGGRVKLHDFGVARMSEESSEYKTEVGTFKGTFQYAAPETFLGQPASARSDLYSCALVLYQMLTGTNPQKGRSSKETLNRVLNQIPPLVSTLRADVPEVVVAALARALGKDPADRFATAAAFAEELRAGRTLTEEEVAEHFSRVIGVDFQGTLPEMLGVESLSVRDSAWRAGQQGEPSNRLPLSSTPPAAPPELSPDAVATVVLRPAVTLAGGTPMAVTPAGQTWAAQAPATGAEPSRRNLRRTLLVGGLGLGGVALGSGGVWLGTHRTPAAPWPSFVVIEKQHVDELPSGAPSACDLPTAGASVRVSATDAPPASGSSPAPPGSTPRSPSSPGGFSRAFQRHQAGVEQCFARYAADVEGQPTVMVRFSIDTKGQVQRAELAPSTLTGTGLGQCLLGEARAARFGPQPEPVTFTIPVTARRTR
jgi:eukaryotic-like serine/threonine-protein kinase